MIRPYKENLIGTGLDHPGFVRIENLNPSKSILQ